MTKGHYAYVSIRQRNYIPVEDQQGLYKFVIDKSQGSQQLEVIPQLLWSEVAIQRLIYLCDILVVQSSVHSCMAFASKFSESNYQFFPYSIRVFATNYLSDNWFRKRWKKPRKEHLILNFTDFWLCSETILSSQSVSCKNLVGIRGITSKLQRWCDLILLHSKKILPSSLIKIDAEGG